MLILSCKEKRKVDFIELKEIVDDALDKSLILPDSLYLYTPFQSYILDSIGIANASIKIYSQIDATCDVCIGKINNWRGFSERLNHPEIPIILIIESHDDFQNIKAYCESGEIGEFPFPFFFNAKDHIANINEFMKESEELNTVLTDKNDQILMVGNPIHSKELEKLYFKEIEKRIK